MPVVNLVAPDGRTRAVEQDSAEYQFALDSGWRPETGAEAAAIAAGEFARQGTEGVAGGILATLAGGARAITGGGSDILLGALGGGEYFDTLREERPYLSLAGEVAGAVTPLGVPGMALRAGERVAGRIAGEGAAATIGRKFVSGAVEGGIQGIGTGVTELALSDDPLTVERIASTLRTGALLGGGIGGGFNVAGHGLATGLQRASKRLRDFADSAVAVQQPTWPGVPSFGSISPDDGLTTTIRAGDLRAAQEARLAWQSGGDEAAADAIGAKVDRFRALRATGEELTPPELNAPVRVTVAPDGAIDLTDGYARLASLPDDAQIPVRFDRGAPGSGIAPPITADSLAGMDARTLRATRKAELEAIEAQRVKARPQLADDIVSYREEIANAKIWTATARAKEREIRAIAKVSIEADKALDRVLRNPKALAADPKRALTALQQEEHALELLVEKTDDLAKKFRRDKRTVRRDALALAPKALERNLALQARIGELVGAPTSQRLAAVDEAIQRLSDAPRQSGFGGAALGIAAGTVGAVPVAGPALAAGAGVAASFMGRLGQKTKEALAAVADRTSRTIDKILDVSAKARPATRAIPVIATRVLAKARYGGADTDEPETKSKGAKPAKPQRLADLYKKRSAELRSLTTLGPDGMPMMRREARARVAAQLSAFAAFDPLLADKIETLTARRVEFLAGRLPRRPDLAALQTGPDRWQPSDMQMRTWARYVAAVEDPGAIEERLVDGSITPEDAEVMREVYPERMEALKAELLARLPQLQRQLPYHRRLALSIFSGVPVDPAMNPQILRVLQASFADEPGSEGGTMAPQASPAFGSVRSQEKPTRAQQRAGT